MSRWPNFNMDKLRCQHCGKAGIDPDFMDQVQLVRTKYGKPMVERSGYRCPHHPIEQAKKKPGEHADGLAIDVFIPAEDFVLVTALWHELGYARVGWNPGSFIHLGGSKTRPQRAWIY